MPLKALKKLPSPKGRERKLRVTTLIHRIYLPQTGTTVYTLTL